MKLILLPDWTTILYIMLGVLLYNLLESYVYPRIDQRIRTIKSNRIIRKARAQSELSDKLVGRQLINNPHLWIKVRFTAYSINTDILHGLVYICGHADPFKFLVLNPMGYQPTVCLLDAAGIDNIILGIRLDTQKIVKERIGRVINMVRAFGNNIKTGADLLTGVGY